MTIERQLLRLSVHRQALESGQRAAEVLGGFEVGRATERAFSGAGPELERAFVEARACEVVREQLRFARDL